MAAHKFNIDFSINTYICRLGLSLPKFASNLPHIRTKLASNSQIREFGASLVRLWCEFSASLIRRGYGSNWGSIQKYVNWSLQEKV